MTRDKFPTISAVEIVVTWQNWMESSCDDDSKCETSSSLVILSFHMLCEILESVKVGKVSEQGRWSHKHGTLEGEGPRWATQSVLCLRALHPAVCLTSSVQTGVQRTLDFPHLVFLSSVNGFAFWPKLEV